jgi:hypothetical protein
MIFAMAKEYALNLKRENHQRKQRRKARLNTMAEMIGSCWLIEFKDGHKVIISEELYKQEVERNWAGRPRLVEEHWFDFRKCRERNRGVLCAGF